MSDTKWTKGPWECVYRDDKLWSPRIFSGSKFVAMVGNSDDTQDKSLADANLIAAAPDGYALAEMVMDICGNPKGVSGASQDKLYEAALQYAKKARGEQ